jgi:hypothetical protein
MTEATRTNADHLRTTAARLLELAEKTDGLKPYVINHSHEYGNTLYLAHFDREPTEEIAESVLQAEFEPDRGEGLVIDDGFSPSCMAGAPSASSTAADGHSVQVFVPVITIIPGGFENHVARINLDQDLVDRMESACLLCSEMNFSSIDVSAVNAAILMDDDQHMPASIVVDHRGFRIRTDAGHDSGLIRPESMRHYLSTDPGVPQVMSPLDESGYATVEAYLSSELDIDDVAEWVGLHYKRNFLAESPESRVEWIQRYLRQVESLAADLQQPEPEARIRPKG